MTTPEILNLIKTDESYKFLETNEHLGKNIILLGLGGSHAYGTNKEGSDVDVRGIATRTPKDICLGRDFETVVDTATDTTIYSLDKMFGLLSECNPNTIEMLGLRPCDYLSMTPTGEEILKNKNIFLSNKCIGTFGGYANQQLYRLRQKSLSALSRDEYNEHITRVIQGMNEHLQRSWNITSDQIKVYNTDTGLKVTITNINDIPIDDFYGINNEISNVIKEYTKESKRNQKAMAHAKISKHAMHLLRLYMMAIDLLTKGEIVTYRDKEHDLLMSIRNGDYMEDVEKDEVIEHEAYTVWLNSNGQLRKRLFGSIGIPTGRKIIVQQMTKEFWDLLKEYETDFVLAKSKSTLPNAPDYNAINRLRFKINSEIMHG